MNTTRKFIFIVKEDGEIEYVNTLRFKEKIEYSSTNNVAGSLDFNNYEKCFNYIHIVNLLNEKEKSNKLKFVYERIDFSVAAVTKRLVKFLNGENIKEIYKTEYINFAKKMKRIDWNIYNSYYDKNIIVPILQKEKEDIERKKREDYIIKTKGHPYSIEFMNSEQDVSRHCGLKVLIIKAIKEITGMGLLDSKKFLDALPNKLEKVYLRDDQIKYYTELFTDNYIVFEITPIKNYNHEKGE